jgi:hypothetical protein
VSATTRHKCARCARARTLASSLSFTTSMRVSELRAREEVRPRSSGRGRAGGMENRAS